MRSSLKVLLTSCQQLSFLQPRASLPCVNYLSIVPSSVGSEAVLTSAQHQLHRNLKTQSSPKTTKVKKNIAPSQLDKLEKFVHVRPPKTDYEEDIKQAISSVTDNEGLKKCLDLFLTNHAAQTWVGKHEYANAGQVSDFIKVCEKVGSSAPLVTLWQSAYRYGVDPTVPLLRSSAAACAALGEGADAALVLLYGSCYIVNVPEDLAAAVRTALEAHEKAQEGNAEALAKVQKYREALDRLKL